MEKNAEISKAKVTIYSIPTCPYCQKAKAFLKENHIEFTDRNVASDAEAREEMVDKSGQMGVPVFDISGKLVIGYDVPAIKKLLKI